MGIKKNRRVYEDTVSRQMWNGKRFVNSGKYSHTVLRPGLKKVHIGEDVWLIGKSSVIKDGRNHQVIYGPDNKEYHLYDKDVEFVNFVPDEFVTDTNLYWGTGNTSYSNRHGNVAYEPHVKIYILTHILDSKENWCFDLNQKPLIGSRVKIIYNNGTVKNIDSFSGEFEKVELISKRWYAGKGCRYFPEDYVYQKFVKPIAYRKNVQ